MSKPVIGLLCLICLTLSGCAGGFGLSEELDRSAKSYNKMMRWHEIESAVQMYAEPEHSEESLKKAALLKKNGLTITDFRILSIRYVKESRSGDVMAEFDYHLLPSNSIKTIPHRQEWVYQDTTKSWKLKNGLPPFE